MATSSSSTLGDGTLTTTSAIVTSTPVGGPRTQCHRDALKSSLTGITVEETADSVVIDSAGPSGPPSVAGDAVTGDDDREMRPGHVAVPITGYEVMEERARFTVFKIQVKHGYDDSWFIFRRYSDFDHLNTKLKLLFPHFRLSLPPKKWFGDNYDRNFLEDRMIGLQAFLNNIVGHKDIINSEPVKDFFCLDDPPGPHDSLEESRALCENLEEKVFCLHQEMAEKDAVIGRMETELNLAKIQVDNLKKALRTECKLYRELLPKSDKIHSDHVLNLLLLDVIERAKNQARRRPLLSTTPELPEEEGEGQTGGDRHGQGHSDSVFMTPDSSLDAAGTRPDSVRMSTISRDAPTQEPAAQTRPDPKSQTSKDPTPQSRPSQDLKTQTRPAQDQSPRHPHSKPHTTPSSPETGPARLTSAQLEPPAGRETVVASSSPTPKRATTAGTATGQHSSPGAHSVDVKSRARRVNSSSSDPRKLTSVQEEDRSSRGADLTAAGVRPKVKSRVVPAQ